jgi:exopolysaccharide biosynthesis predicted pyruvyltransferase EpsI
MLTQPKTAITSILPAGEWSSLARCLRDFAARAQDLCYVPNVGNVGDALIASGAWQFFDAIGLRPRIVHATRVSMFCHDLALRLDVKSLQLRCTGPVPFATLVVRACKARRLRSYLRWRRYARSVQPVNGTLQVFRNDVEAVSLRPGDSLQDISAAYGSEYLDRLEHDFVARDLLDTIGRAEVIVTNRLHIGIAGALLNKRVRLYDNCYGKLRDVYQSSLQGCPLVSFHGK